MYCPFSLVEVALNPSKVADYIYNFCAAIALMGHIFPGWSLLDLFTAEYDGWWLFFPRCLHSTFYAMKTIQQKWHFLVITNLIYPCPVTKICGVFSNIILSLRTMSITYIVWGASGILRQITQRELFKHDPIIFIWPPSTAGRTICLNE